LKLNLRLKRFGRGHGEEKKRGTPLKKYLVMGSLGFALTIPNEVERAKFARNTKGALIVGTEFEISRGATGSLGSLKKGRMKPSPWAT